MSLASIILALSKFAPERLALVKSKASVKSTSNRLASIKSVSIKLALLKFVWLRFAYVNFAFLKFSPAKSRLAKVAPKSLSLESSIFLLGGFLGLQTLYIFDILFT